jgi:O-antigen/teichoic acid export membrane protein
LQIRRTFIVGDIIKKDRLFAFIKYSFKIYGIIIIIALIMLIYIGWFFFKKQPDNIFYLWCMYSFYGALSIFLALVQTVLQGLNKMKEVFLNIFISSILTTFFICSLLFLKFELASLIIGSLIGLLISAFGLCLFNKNILIQILKSKTIYTYQFFRETSSLQLKFAISFISSYIIGYVTVPAVFKFLGVEIAGQLGLTLMILTAFIGFANNWIFTRVPKFNYLIASSLIKDAYVLFKKSILMGFLVCITLNILFCAFLITGKYYYPSIIKRFTNIDVLILVSLTMVINYVIDAFTIFLRSFKKEPLLYIQIFRMFLILLNILISFILLKSGLFMFCLINFLTALFIILPIAFFRFKKELNYQNV